MKIRAVQYLIFKTHYIFNDIIQLKKLISEWVAI